MPAAPQVVLVANSAALAEAAAAAILDAACAAVDEHGRFTIALAGGATPASTYMRLAQPPFADVMPWDKTWVLFGGARLRSRGGARESQGGEGLARRERAAARGHGPARGRRAPLVRRRGGRGAPAAQRLMRVAVACDHRGFAYKAPMLQALEADGHVVIDLGTNSDA